MSDLLAGVGITTLAAIFIVIPAALIARMQDKGTRCAFRRPPALAIAWAELRAILTPQAREMHLADARFGSSAGNAEADESPAPRPQSDPAHEVPGAVAGAGLAPLWAVRHDGVIAVDAGGHISARKLMRIPVAATAGLPLLDGQPVKPMPPGRLPPHIAEHFDRQPVYGERCVLDVQEAERAFTLAHGPDGCEEVPAT